MYIKEVILGHIVTFVVQQVFSDILIDTITRNLKNFKNSFFKKNFRNSLSDN